MNKLCVFCGKPPKSKNKEHIIPRWLIAMTGDPNREVYLGRKWRSDDLAERLFSFSHFTVPACEDCNSRFAALERSTKPILQAVLDLESLSASEWHTLLDWFDKIRTGLWLASMSLNQNHLGISPMFHIERRIAAKDRLLVVYHIEGDDKEGIMWGGTDSPIFNMIPSCFTLTVNNILFLNASYDFLLARGFGLPFPNTRFVRSGGGEYVEMNPGTGVISSSLLAFDFPKGGRQLLQPMIPWLQANGDEAGQFMRGLYDRQHVRACCDDFEQGRGFVYVRSRNTAVPYPEEQTRQWVPYRSVDRATATFETAVCTGAILESLLRNHADVSRLSEDERTSIKTQVDEAIRLHRAMMLTIAGPGGQTPQFRSPVR